MYNAIVVGAGSIGAWKGNKFDSPITKNILTHAHMYYKHPEVNLISIIEKDPKRAIEAANKWGCNWQQGVYPMEGIDIVSVCTPTNTHRNILMEVIDICPRIVIAEKPFCSNTEEAEEVIAAYEKEGIPILINYSRDYVPEIRALDMSLSNGQYGKILSAVFHYTRGLVHEGCHAIDLLTFLFGHMEQGHILNPRYSITDREESDPTVAAYLSFNKCPHVFLSPCDGNKYKVFQLEIMTEAGKIILSQHGKYIDFYPTVKEPIWGDFNILSKDLGSRYETQLDNALPYILSEVISYLKKPEKDFPFSCIATNALETHKIINFLKRGQR